MTELDYWSDLIYGDVRNGEHRERVSISANRPALGMFLTDDELDAMASRRQWLDAMGGTDGMDRVNAAAGETVPGWLAAEMLDIKPGTLRVWTHRGKLPVVTYEADDTGQRCAIYRLADVLTLRDARTKKS